MILIIQVEALLGGNLNVNDTGSAVAEFSSDHHQRYSKIAFVQTVSHQHTK